MSQYAHTDRRAPFWLCRLTGSRLFGVHTRQSDWDWYTDEYPGQHQLRGWSSLGYGCRDGYWIFHRGNHHLIVAMSEEADRRWKAAERHCLIERPRSKQRRKVIFDHYLYGMPLHRNKPLPGYCRNMWDRRVTPILRQKT